MFFYLEQNSPIQIIHLDNEFSCIKWLPTNGSLVIVSASNRTDLFPLQVTIFITDH